MWGLLKKKTRGAFYIYGLLPEFGAGFNIFDIFQKGLLLV
jgi:hypothetical protein